MYTGSDKQTTQTYSCFHGMDSNTICNVENKHHNPLVLVTIALLFWIYLLVSAHRIDNYPHEAVQECTIT